MLHKYEYAENASNVEWHHRFQRTFEYQSGLSIKLCGKFNMPIKSEKTDFREYNLKLKTGNMYWNIKESTGFSCIKNMFPDLEECKKFSIEVRDVEDVFEIRSKYPSVDILECYYSEANLDEVNLFVEYFSDIFDAVVAKSGSEYRKAVMQGATELAFACSHSRRQLANHSGNRPLETATQTS